MFHGLGFRVSGLQGHQADESCGDFSRWLLHVFYMEPAS